MKPGSARKRWMDEASSHVDDPPEWFCPKSGTPNFLTQNDADFPAQNGVKKGRTRKRAPKTDRRATSSPRRKSQRLSAEWCGHPLEPPRSEQITWELRRVERRRSKIAGGESTLRSALSKDRHGQKRGQKQHDIAVAGTPSSSRRTSGRGSHFSIRQHLRENPGTLE